MSAGLRRQKGPDKLKIVSSAQRFSLESREASAKYSSGYQQT